MITKYKIFEDSDDDNYIWSMDDEWCWAKCWYYEAILEKKFKKLKIKEIKVRYEANLSITIYLDKIKSKFIEKNFKGLEYEMEIISSPALTTIEFYVEVNEQFFKDLDIEQTAKKYNL